MNAAMLLSTLSAKFLAGKNSPTEVADNVSLLAGGQASGDFAAMLAQQFDVTDGASLVTPEQQEVQPEVAQREAAELIDFSSFISSQASMQTQPLSVPEVPLQAQALVDPALTGGPSAVVAAVMPYVAAPVRTSSENDLQAAAETQPVISRGLLDKPFADAAQRQPIATAPASFAVSESVVEPVVQPQVAVPQVVTPQHEFDAVLSDMMAMPQTNSGNSAALASVATLQVAAAQPASAQPASNQPVAVLAPVVGQSAWGEALGDRMVWMVSQQHQGVELHLNPPALGPLEVRLSMHEGQATLSFATQHLPVKEALESATPRLKEMLGESGINLAGVSVNVGSFGQQRGSFEQREPVMPVWTAGGEGQEASLSQVVSGTSRVISGRGMVDLFA